MVPTVSSLLSVEEFALKTVVHGDNLDRDIVWLHSSDLPNPTLFLEPGSALITTGSQLLNKSETEIENYVITLKEFGILCVGFGSGIYHKSPPAAMVEACSKHKLTLFELPYELPGMALSRWVADRHANKAREREIWTIDTMKSVSLAALHKDGLSSVLGELARRLDLDVLLLDEHSEVLLDYGKKVLNDDVRAAVIQNSTYLLEKSQRASKTIAADSGYAMLQTLGKTENLLGVLAVASYEPLSREQLLIVTNVVVLAELSLQFDQRVQDAIEQLRSEVIGFLVDGHTEVANKVATSIGNLLPGAPLRIALLRPTKKVTSKYVQMLISRSKLFAGTTIFTARLEDKVLVLLPADNFELLAKCVKEYDLTAGISKSGGYKFFQGHLDQARFALNHTEDPGDVSEYQPEMDEDIVTLLGKPVIKRLAEYKLRAVTELEDGAVLINSLKTWLEHKGSWNSASKALGIHRHSLRNMITKVERVLDVDLDDFETRVYIWALLKFQ